MTLRRRGWVGFERLILTYVRVCVVWDAVGRRTWKKEMLLLLPRVVFKCTVTVFYLLSYYETMSCV